MDGLLVKSPKWQQSEVGPETSPLIALWYLIYMNLPPEHACRQNITQTVKVNFKCRKISERWLLHHYECRAHRLSSREKNATEPHLTSVPGILANASATGMPTYSASQEIAKQSFSTAVFTADYILLAVYCNMKLNGCKLLAHFLGKAAANVEISSCNNTAKNSVFTHRPTHMMNVVSVCFKSAH